MKGLVFGDLKCSSLGRPYSLSSFQGDQVSGCWDFHLR